MHTSECTSKYTSECTSKYTSECTSECTSKYTYNCTHSYAYFQVYLHECTTKSTHNIQAGPLKLLPTEGSLFAAAVWESARCPKRITNLIEVPQQEFFGLPFIFLLEIASTPHRNTSSIRTAVVGIDNFAFSVFHGVLKADVLGSSPKWNDFLFFFIYLFDSSLVSVLQQERG